MIWFAEFALQYEFCVSHFLTTECDVYKKEFYLFFLVQRFLVTEISQRPALAHIEEFSMTFQDCHETGLYERLVNIALNGQAIETHGRRPRICSLASLSYLSHNRSVLKCKNLGVLHQVLDQGLLISNLC